MSSSSTADSFFSARTSPSSTQSDRVFTQSDIAFSGMRGRINSLNPNTIMTNPNPIALLFLFVIGLIFVLLAILYLEKNLKIKSQYNGWIVFLKIVGWILMLPFIFSVISRIFFYLYSGRTNQ